MIDRKNDWLRSNPTKQIVYESKDYGKFRFLDYNRFANPERVKKIAKSLSKMGQLEPAIVTTKGEIVSGQGRFKACRFLNEPFRYLIMEDSVIEDHDTLMAMLEIHTIQSTFTLGECLDTYCNLSRNDDKYESYKWFRRLKEEYKIAPRNLMMVIAQGWDNNKRVEETFRCGELSVTKIERDRVEKSMNWIADIDQLRPFNTKNRIGATNQVFMKCVLQLLKWKNFDEKRFIDQVSRHRIRLEATVDLMWDELNHIYNLGMRKTQKSYLPEMKSLDKKKTPLKNFKLQPKTGDKFWGTAVEA